MRVCASPGPVASTPYHICDGLVEKVDGNIKEILKRLCLKSEQNRGTTAPP